MSKAKTSTIAVRGTAIAIITGQNGDYISLTDMLKAKDGEFFISDWLRNRNTVEFLGIWESVFNPDFNYGEFAIIKSQAGLNSYKISVKEWVEKTNAIGREILRSGSRDASLIEHTLDHLLDHACIPQGLSLFKSLCRHYHGIAPAATATYVYAYRDMWDSDDQEPQTHSQTP